MLAGDKTLTKKVLAFHGILTAQVRDGVSRQRRLGGRHQVPADRQAAAGGRVARHHAEVDRERCEGAARDDQLAADGVSVAGARRGVHRRPRVLRRRARQQQRRRRCRSSSSTSPDIRKALDAPLPGRAIHGAPAQAPRGPARADRVGADPRPRGAPVGRPDRAGRLVRRAPVAAAST